MASLWGGLGDYLNKVHPTGEPVRSALALISLPTPTFFIPHAPYSIPPFDCVGVTVAVTITVTLCPYNCQPALPLLLTPPSEIVLCVRVCGKVSQRCGAYAGDEQTIVIGSHRVRF